MDLVIETPMPYLRSITATYGPDELDREYDIYLKEAGKKVALPGFRKGKVPLPILKKHFGESLSSELAEKLVKKALLQALDEADFIPVMRPRLESGTDLKLGEEFRVKISIEVRPPIELKEYKGLKLKSETVAVSEEDIDGALDSLRRRFAHLKPAEDRPAKFEDFIEVEFDRKDTEKPEEHSFYIDQEVTRDFAGKKPGDSFEGHFEFPDDWPQEELAGSSFDATARVLELKEIELPELNEEFIEQLGDEFESLESLRAAVREDMTNARKNEADRHLRNAARAELVARNPVELSPNVIEAVIEDTMNQYWKVEELDEDQKKEISTRLHPQVSQDLASDIIISEIIKAENIEVGDDELKEYVKEIALANNMEPEELYRTWKKKNQLDSVVEDIKIKKALDIVIDNAEITYE